LVKLLFKILAPVGLQALAHCANTKFQAAAAAVAEEDGIEGDRDTTLSLKQDQQQQQQQQHRIIIFLSEIILKS
jgi:hypothetical protein